MSGYDGSAMDAFDFHHSMLADEVRTSTFLRAITEVVKPGDVVVDIGSLEVEIPERADVLVTETIGNVGFDEGICTWVADARTRFPKRGALVVPGRVDAVASLVSVPRDFRAVEKWSQPLQTLDFAPLTRAPRECFHRVPVRQTRQPSTATVQ